MLQVLLWMLRRRSCLSPAVGWLKSLSGSDSCSLPPAASAHRLAAPLRRRRAGSAPAEGKERRRPEPRPAPPPGSPPRGVLHLLTAPGKAGGRAEIGCGGSTRSFEFRL